MIMETVDDTTDPEPDIIRSFPVIRDRACNRLHHSDDDGVDHISFVDSVGRVCNNIDSPKPVSLPDGWVAPIPDSNVFNNDDISMAVTQASSWVEGLLHQWMADNNASIIAVSEQKAPGFTYQRYLNMFNANWCEKCGKRVDMLVCVRHVSATTKQCPGCYATTLHIVCEDKSGGMVLPDGSVLSITDVGPIVDVTAPTHFANTEEEHLKLVCGL